MNIVPIEAKLIDSMGSDLSVVNAARVSFAKESEWDMVEREIAQEDVDSNPYPEYPIDKILTPVLKESDKKLINYLAKHKHFSPFNHTFLSFRVKAPIFVARQLVKHEYMPWNEVSRRYVKDEPSFHPIRFRWAADNVKQGSGEEVDQVTQDACDYVFWKAVDHALEAYNYLLGRGISAEQARAVLPVNTNTEWIWSGTLKAFHKMLELRLDPHTQYEAQVVANLIKPQIEQVFPVSLAALLDNK